MSGLLQLRRRDFLRTSGATLCAGLFGGGLRADGPVPVPAIDERLRKLAEDAPLAMQFHGSTAEQCRQWQEEFAAKLRSLLGPHAPPKQWKTEVERTVELADHRRQELVLTADGQPPLPIYLLTPLKKSEKKRAGIVAIHGHGNFGYDPIVGRDDLPGVAAQIQSIHYDYGRQMVRRGYVVAAPCLTPFGRRLGKAEKIKELDACGLTFVRMQMFGKVLMAENLRDCLWAVELLARHEEVDPQRLGCIGLSYGGRMTMLTSALEPRIRVAAVSGALNVMQERVSKAYGCGAQIIPGLLAIGDVPEIGSLIAPRPCVWEVGAHDGLMIPRWVEEALKRMGRAYKAFGAEANLMVDRFEGGHEWSGRKAYPLFDKVLS